MGVFMGTCGYVEWASSPIDLVTSFNININVDTVDSTSMEQCVGGDTGGYKVFVVGFKDWTATVDCLVNDPDGIHNPNITTSLTGAASATLILTTDDEGISFTGTAFCTSINAKLDKDGTPTVTYEFVGAGALTVNYLG
jgi:hypothetical protein